MTAVGFRNVYFVFHCLSYLVGLPIFALLESLDFIILSRNMQNIKKMRVAKSNTWNHIYIYIYIYIYIIQLVLLLRGCWTLSNWMSLLNCMIKVVHFSFCKSSYEFWGLKIKYATFLLFFRPLRWKVGQWNCHFQICAVWKGGADVHIQESPMEIKL